MRKRYKSALFFIFILIGACVTLGVFYYLYENYFAHQAVVVADGNLTINYLNGNKFHGKTDQKISFSVTNNGNNEETYYIRLAKITADDVKYHLVGTDNEIDITNDLYSSIIKNQIAIAPKATQNYELAIATSHKYQGEIVVALSNKESMTFGDLIIENNKVYDKPLTSFAENATVNEGLIKVKSEKETIYYFRGDIDNNYVSFANNLWRIVKINEDGSVKLVLNNLIETTSGYQTGEDFAFNESLIHLALTDWFSVYLESYTEQIASHKFCNDLVIEEGEETYAAFNRISKNFIPNPACLGDTLVSKIGLLTADEVAMAGGTSTENKNYYLYNDNITSSYYTMTSAKYTQVAYYPYVVEASGALADDISSTTALGIRPVINIIKNIAATGTGTSDDPYILMDI